MTILLFVTLGITVTQPAILDQTEEEWIAPGFRVIEEVSIDPLDYGDPVSWNEHDDRATAKLGCQVFFVSTESGEKWRIILLLKDRLVVLQEDEEARTIPLTCSPREIIYSRNGQFALVLGSAYGNTAAVTSIDADFVDIEAGSVRKFEPLSNTGWSGMQFVNDDGSIYRWDYTAADLLEYYDPDLNLVSSRGISICLFTRFAHASGGSIILFAVPDKLTVYDKDGVLLWDMDLDTDLPCNPLITADGSFVMLATEEGLECYEGMTGELLWAENSGRTVLPVPSISGYAWAARSRASGLLSGVDIREPGGIISVSYSGESWNQGGPFAVSQNGAFLSVYRNPDYFSNPMNRFVYTDREGRAIWASCPLSIASSQFDLRCNRNVEMELLSCIGVQSDGERFALFDYSSIRVFRIESGE